MKYTEEQIEDILDRVSSLLDQYGEAEAKFQDDQNHKHWNETYGERLGAYSDKLKKLNGDDFDVVDAARKEYASDYSDISEDEYVDALEANIKKVLDRVWPEATEEQKQEVVEAVKEEADAPEGENKVETHVEAEDKDGDGKISEEEVETHTLEEQDSKENDEEEGEEKEEEDPVAAQYREFEEEFKKLPKRNK